MGKDKNKKFKACKPRPTGLPSVKDCESELANSQTVSTQTIENLIEKLSSPSEEERECSCAGIAGLVTQPQVISRLLQHNVIKILGPLILDHSLQVRHCALGALRNLSVDGGVEVCEEMVQRDVLTPLVTLFKQYGVEWIPNKDKKQKDYRTENFTEAVHLLWNLCETNDTAVDIFNRESLVLHLWPCLQHSVYGEDVAITAGQCLHTVTEDNTQLSTLCRQPAMLSMLQTLVSETANSSGHMLLKTLATGILVNVSGDQLSSASLDLMSQVVTSISNVFDVDAQEAFKSAIQKSSQESSDLQKCMEKEYGVQESEDLSDVENILAAQQVALEIVANLCCTEDDWEDLDSSESSSDDMVIDTPMEEAENGLFSPLCIPSEVQGAISNSDIFNKVVRKGQSVQFDGMEITNKRKTVIKSFERLQVHALLCVNNLVSSVDIQALGGLDNVHKVWTGLGMLSLTQQAKENSEILEAVTSAMRAVVVKLVECESPEIYKVELRDLQILFEMGQQCQLRDVRVNVVRIVSTIGCLLAKLQSPHPFLQNIGLFLLEVCCKDVELWVVAEALDSIFDVFGEDHLKPVITEIRLIDRLQQLQPILKAKIKSSKQNLGEHYPVISTARTNLVRFIKYKASH